MTLLAPLGAIALLAIPAIVLLYFLKIKRPEVRVSTLMLWLPQLVDRQADQPRREPASHRPTLGDRARPTHGTPAHPEGLPYVWGGGCAAVGASVNPGC